MSDREYPWHTEALQRELAGAGRMPHALLLLGTPGIGKSAYAMALAGALLCESPAQDGRACGRCDACGWIAADSHPDLRRLGLRVDDDGKVDKEIKVEQARALGDFLVVGAHRGGRRVVVVDPADAMNAVTANAMLKTLEEPGDGLLFVLASARPDAIPATIRSRCQVRVLEGPPLDVASAWLQGQSGCTPQEAGTWLAMAGGAPLHALRFAEPGQAAAHRAMLETIAKLPDTPIVAAADALQSADARQWLPLLQRWLMDVGRCRTGAAPRYFPAQAARLRELAERTDPASLAEAGRALAAQYRHVEHPLNARLFAETVLDGYLGAFAPGRSAAGG
ncbi:MAG TPA: AAA family ATPase [Burkholderiaceae bacterium]|nr:AAA family ATPase [Burkholderiaceae bacterium]